MSTTQPLEEANTIFRMVLLAVTPDRLGQPTPCKSFTVTQLVNHTIGTHSMIIDALRDKPFNAEPIDVAADAAVATFDDAAADALAELRRDGAMDKTVTLPFGTFTGAELMGMGSLDTFQHAWDLATATGQNTDLAPELATALQALAEAHMEHAPRGDEPAPYAPEQFAPAGAPAADHLAAFLGRSV